MSLDFLGVLAGVGDRLRDRNAEESRKAEADRQAFARDLERVMESEDWPEQARLTAAQMRAELYSNRKLKAKDYPKLWENVRNSSGRPVSGAAERNTQRGALPQMEGMLSGLGQMLGASGQMPTGASAGQLPAGPSGNPEGVASAPPAPTAPTSLSMLAPGLGVGVEAIRRQMAETVRSLGTQAEPVTAYGPWTRGERSQHQMAELKHQLDMVTQLQGGEAGEDSNLIVKPHMVGGKLGFYTSPRSIEARQAQFRRQDGSVAIGMVERDRTTGNWVAADTNEPVEVLQAEGVNRTLPIATIGPDGKPVTYMGGASEVRGQTFGKYVPKKFIKSTGANGEQFLVTVDGHTGQPLHASQIGMMPFADLIEQGRVLGNQQKEMLLRIAPYVGSIIVDDTINGGQMILSPRALIAQALGMEENALPTTPMPAGALRLEGKRREGFDSLRGALEQLASAKELIEKHGHKFGGVFGLKGRYSKWLQGAIKVTPEERDIYTRLEMFFNNYRVMVTGAQAGLPEIQILRTVTPDITNPNFLADIDARLAELGYAYIGITGHPWQRRGLPNLTQQQLTPTPRPQRTAAPAPAPPPDVAPTATAAPTSDEQFDALMKMTMEALQPTPPPGGPR